MFAVIFEVQPKKERWEEYLSLARLLKPELERIDGFIDNERFASRRREGRLLSLSIWRNEKSLVRWRTQSAHHAVQEKGRFEVFADYRLRVGEITADSEAAPGPRLADQRLDETEAGEAKAVTISGLAPAEGERPASADLAGDAGLPAAGTEGVLDHESFASIYRPGTLLLLVSWHDAAAAERWTPRAVAGAMLRHRRVRVIRDYGMFDRREAPQYYAEVARPRSP